MFWIFCLVVLLFQYIVGCIQSKIASLRSRGSSNRPGGQFGTQQPDQLLVCQICKGRRTIEQMPSLEHAGHGREICRQCLARWIESQLDSKGWENIACPSSRCRTPLKFNDVKRYAIPKVFARYRHDKLSTDSDRPKCKAS